MLQGKLRGSLLPPELEGGHIALRALPTGNVRTPRVACKAQPRDHGVTMMLPMIMLPFSTAKGFRL